MLPTQLNTNEVKNAAGTEVEFSRRFNDESSLLFAKVGEAPNLTHRLKVGHQEIGEGVEMRRRSVVRFDIKVTGVSGKTRNIALQTTADIPVGDIANLDVPKDGLAELVSFLASTGADTTIKFDCSGNGAAALLNGTY